MLNASLGAGLENVVPGVVQTFSNYGATESDILEISKMILHSAIRISEENISKIDTFNWKKHPITFIRKCRKGLKNTENLIILPAHNGVKVFVPLFNFWNKFYHKKIFYADQKIRFEKVSLR